MNFKRIIFFFSIIAFLFLFSYFYPEPTGKTAGYKSEKVLLSRVVDGDTIEVIHNDEILKVRLLGISTPEKNMPLSKEAINYLKQFENKTLILEADFEDEDRYKRKLRYAFYKNTFINKEILKKGFGNAYMFSSLKYKKELLKAEEQARENREGIWDRSYETCAVCIELRSLNEKEEYFILENNCAFTCNLQNWFVKDAGRNVLKISSITSGQIARINSTKEIWSEHDKFFLFDSDGKLVIYYAY